MRQLDLDLHIVTPIFMGGADAGNLANEVRVPSIRGELRYWLRALLGRTTPDVAALREREAQLLGSTTAGSLVRLRVLEQPTRLMTAQRMMLPHREGGPKLVLRQTAFVENQALKLCLMARPGLTTLPNELVAALLLWINLGGLGKRARRGFGSMQITAVHDAGELVTNETAQELLNSQPTDAVELQDHLAKLMNWVESIAPAAHALADPPAYPILAPEMANVLVSEAMSDYGQPHPDYRQAMVPFWLETLRNRALRDEHAYGYVGNYRGSRRRASPLHLHIAQTPMGYHLVLTSFWSEPAPDGAEGWNKMEDLLRDCQTRWGAKRVWGRVI